MLRKKKSSASVHSHSHPAASQQQMQPMQQRGQKPNPPVLKSKTSASFLRTAKASPLVFLSAHRKSEDHSRDHPKLFSDDDDDEGLDPGTGTAALGIGHLAGCHIHPHIDASNCYRCCCRHRRMASAPFIPRMLGGLYRGIQALTRRFGEARLSSDDDDDLPRSHVSLSPESAPSCLKSSSNMTILSSIPGDVPASSSESSPIIPKRSVFSPEKKPAPMPEPAPAPAPAPVTPNPKISKLSKTFARVLNSARTNKSASPKASSAESEAARESPRSHNPPLGSRLPLQRPSVDLAETSADAASASAQNAPRQDDLVRSREPLRSAGEALNRRQSTGRKRLSLHLKPEAHLSQPSNQGPDPAPSDHKPFSLFGTRTSLSRPKTQAPTIAQSPSAVSVTLAGTDPAPLNPSSSSHSFEPPYGHLYQHKAHDAASVAASSVSGVDAPPPPTQRSVRSKVSNSGPLRPLDQSIPSPPASMPTHRDRSMDVMELEHGHSQQSILSRETDLSQPPPVAALSPPLVPSDDPEAVEQLRSTILELEGKVLQLSSDLAAARGSYEAASDKADYAVREADELRNKLERSHDTIEQLNRRLEEAQSVQAGLSSEIGMLHDRSRMDVDERVAQHIEIVKIEIDEAHRTTIGTLRKDLSNLETLYQLSQQEIEDFKGQLSEAQFREQDANMHCQRLMEAITKLKQERLELFSLLQAEKSKTTRNESDFAAFNRKFKLLSDSNQQLKEENEHLRVELRRYQYEVATDNSDTNGYYRMRAEQLLFDNESLKALCEEYKRRLDQEGISSDPGTSSGFSGKHRPSLSTDRLRQGDFAPSSAAAPSFSNSIGSSVAISQNDRAAFDQKMSRYELETMEPYEPMSLSARRFLVDDHAGLPAMRSAWSASVEPPAVYQSQVRHAGGPSGEGYKSQRGYTTNGQYHTVGSVDGVATGQNESQHSTGSGNADELTRSKADMQRHYEELVLEKVRRLWEGAFAVLEVSVSMAAAPGSAIPRAVAGTRAITWSTSTNDDGDDGDDTIRLCAGWIHLACTAMTTQQQKLTQDLSKIPPTGGSGAMRRKREEIENRLDTVEKEIQSLKRKIKSTFG
ncbi:uncharacterized protein BJ171DRAFT_568567 [Polychytrium aggregatum]|uniref:uncharacterized protein n=1 Tax=Polychytrium aggregatum TaxID=110093 RepID=UPI0022FE9920|nr:uncharacterized protein BJ171DRAFT_568567 [Polychytrium aggregatum]KAI9204124.1 hypothetical protein BJ171DRAFT_568567 [Polychytrium aggregatum]